jgi:putative SOS response-associated peptidase YedK
MCAFSEFTVTKSPQAKHRFTLAGSPTLGLAGLRREGRGNAPNSFTLLTEPGPDVAPYHNRQVAVLKPVHRRAWLAKPEAELLSPLPAGTLGVEMVREGKDQTAAR